MLQTLLIADNDGNVYYNRSFGKEHYDPPLFSGLISAIHLVGFQLFKKDVASIVFGEHQNGEQIFVITRDIPAQKRTINFVFVCDCTCDQKVFREVATAIFIEIKPIVNSNLLQNIQRIVDKIIDTRFNGLKSYCA